MAAEKARDRKRRIVALRIIDEWRDGDSRRILNERFTVSPGWVWMMGSSNDAGGVPESALDYTWS